MHIATYIVSIVCICLSIYNLYCSWHFHQKPDIGLFPRSVLVLQSSMHSTYKRTFKIVCMINQSIAYLKGKHISYYLRQLISYMISRL